MPPTAEDRLHDMLGAIRRIEAIIKDCSFEEFSADDLIRMATERYLEIVCEASRHLPDAVKSEAPHIDWRRMVDFGNRLRHAYRTTDVLVVWQILQMNIPQLKTFAEARLPDSGDE